jgi:hypothetical protein
MDVDDACHNAAGMLADVQGLLVELPCSHSLDLQFHEGVSQNRTVAHGLHQVFHEQIIHQVRELAKAANAT